jgi:thiosulfate/3-mercaptopyruvate sulfurtransferase
MKLFKRSTAILLLLMVVTAANAQFDIITAKDARKLVDDDNVIFVSNRKADDYAKVHIQNAINLEIGAFYQEGEIEGLLMKPEDMVKVLSENGIDPFKTIIVYDNGRYVNAGYFYFVLKYLGYPDVKILDGHMTGWRAARGPVTRTPFTRPAVEFKPDINNNLMVDYDYVKSKLNSAATLIVDVSTPEQFAEGHIPGAINMENKLLFDEDSSTLNSTEEINKVLADHNITTDKEIILYCATSARAGTVYMAMTALGYDNVKIYDGGWVEYKTK